MRVLLHGTTRTRAERLISSRPDPNFVEPGGGPRAENFSTYLDSGPFAFGAPEEYACLKAALFPSEGGAVILRIEVPDAIVALATDENFPLEQGIIQFDEGMGSGRVATGVAESNEEPRIGAMSMNTLLQLFDAITHAFEHPTGGVLGMVDELLALCPEHGLRLEWRADRCWVLPSAENGTDGSFVVSIRKSVFRAILARLAVLCNERTANSVSLYGGHGVLLVNSNPTKAFRVKLVNTTAEQHLELLPEA